MQLSSLRLGMGICVLAAALACATVAALVSATFPAAQRHDQTAVVGLRSPMPRNELKDLETAAEAGDREAQSRLAHEISLYQGYGIRAFQLIRQAAYQQHPYSQYELGAMFAGEILVWERDSAEIVKLGTAHLDDVTWTEEVGVQGRRLAIDHIKALHWFEKAAENGEYLAWGELATIYKEGRGVHPDPSESARWVKKLASAGDPGYMLDYASRLDQGQGVSPDPNEAYAWSLLVVESAYPAASAIGSKARTIQRGLERKLSSDEMVAARLRAKELAKHTSVCVGGIQNCQ
jgi:TPR repeat protein